MMKSGSSRILLAMSRRELAPDGAKIEPGRSPVSEEQPASFSSIFSKTYLSMGRPSKYSSRFTIPPGPWYIQSSFSSFFLVQEKEKRKGNGDSCKPTHKTWTQGRENHSWSEQGLFCRHVARAKHGTSHGTREEVELTSMKLTMQWADRFLHLVQFMGETVFLNPGHGPRLGASHVSSTKSLYYPFISRTTWHNKHILNHLVTKGNFSDHVCSCGHCVLGLIFISAQDVMLHLRR